MRTSPADARSEHFEQLSIAQSHHTRLITSNSGYPKPVVFLIWIATESPSGVDATHRRSRRPVYGGYRMLILWLRGDSEYRLA